LRSFKLVFVPFKNLRYLGIGGLSEYESISKSSQSCYKNSVDRTLGRESHIHFLDIGDQFLSSDGAISPEIMPDGLHPNDRGYQIFAEALEPVISRYL
jgi:lysophospholipase L1-like esterase